MPFNPKPYNPELLLKCDALAVQETDPAMAEIIQLAAAKGITAHCGKEPELLQLRLDYSNDPTITALRSDLAKISDRRSYNYSAKDHNLDDAVIELHGQFRTLMMNSGIETQVGALEASARGGSLSARERGAPVVHIVEKPSAPLPTPAKPAPSATVKR